jgi:hypothetical protein
MTRGLHVQLSPLERDEELSRPSNFGIHVEARIRTGDHGGDKKGGDTSEAELECEPQCH